VADWIEEIEDSVDQIAEVIYSLVELWYLISTSTLWIWVILDGADGASF
jgi:hypothetical protein